MATTASTTEQREIREQDKAAKVSVVVVDLDEPQSSARLRGLRKGRGKLYNHVQRIIKDLAEDGTVKATAQPIVIVVRQLPNPLWFLGDGDD